MGDPWKISKKYSKPKNPWQSDRIEDERKIVKEYGLKNKKELWRAITFLRKFRRHGRRLLARENVQSEKEERQLLDRLRGLNIVKESSTLDDVLNLRVTDFLDRRLQSLVSKKGLANTINQARQFTVHGHVSIGGKKVSSPSYLVRKEEEDKIKLTSDAIKNLNKKKTKKDEKNEVKGK